MKKLFIFLLCALLLLPGAALATDVTPDYDVLRLHIIAHSDQERDQQIKLAVRDEIVRTYSPLWADAPAASWLYDDVAAMADEIRKTADSVLEDFGVPYRSRVETGVMPFPIRRYGDYLCPAGDYYAVRVLLGDADGQNWWCVLYPALCLGEDYTEDRLPEVRSRLWELLAPDTLLEKYPTFGMWLASVFHKGGTHEA